MKRGDVIVCIDTRVEDEIYLKGLTKYKSYTVLGATVLNITIIDDYNDIRNFRPDRFIDIAEFRDQKLKELGV